MIQSKEEFNSLKDTLASSGWAIFKRLVQDDIAKYFREAKGAKDKDVAFISIQKYKAIEDMLQKPYHVLNESEFKKEEDK